MLKANPDAPQLPVRARALADGELGAWPSPPGRRAPVHPAGPTAHRRPTAPRRLHHRFDRRRAAGRRGRAGAGGPGVCGSVAVNRQGARVGKGGGFSDLEFALLVDAGLIGNGTCWPPPSPAAGAGRGAARDPARLPSGPDRRRRRGDRLPPHRRPPGILWEHLDAAKIPALSALARRRAQPKP